MSSTTDATNHQLRPKAVALISGGLDSMLAAKVVQDQGVHVAEQLGIRLHVIDIVEEYKDILLNPRHGYGQHLNPCLNCKIFMIGRAREWADAQGYDFIITGEVMGQRPKSQRKQAMPLIARKSGVADRLLRPLCAKHMPETLPEREGWVDRSRLHSFRNRKPQIELARTLARYGHGRTERCVSVQVEYPDGRAEVRTIRPYHETDIPGGWHI